MTQRWHLGILILLVGLVAPTGAPPAQAALAGKEVKFGGVFSITGKGAEWGENGKIGTEIAVEEINAAGGVGGVPLRVIISDTGTEVAPAIALTRKMVQEDKVLAVMGRASRPNSRPSPPSWTG